MSTKGKKAPNSFNRTSRTQRTHPKDFYAQVQTPEQALYGNTVKPKHQIKAPRDQVDFLFKDFAATQRSMEERLNRNVPKKPKDWTQNRIRFEEKEERRRMAEQMRRKKERERRDNEGKSKRLEWGESAGQFSKPRQVNGRKKGEPSKGRFASKSRSRSRVRVKSKSAKRADHPKKDARKPKRHSHTSRGVKRSVSRRQKSQKKVYEDLQETKQERRPSRKDKRQDYRVKAQRHSVGGKPRRVGEDRNYGRNWKGMQATGDLEGGRFIEELDRIAKFDDTRAMAMMNEMINLQIAKETEHQKLKRQQEDRQYINAKVQNDREKREFDKKMEREKFDLWRMGVKRQLDQKERDAEARRSEDRRFNRDLKREEEKGRLERQRRAEREETKRKKYLGDLAEQIDQDREDRRRRLAKSVQLDRLIGNILIDERPRKRQEMRKKEFFRKMVDEQKREDRRLREEKKLRKEMEQQEQRNLLKNEKKKERRFQENLRRREKSLMKKQMEEQELQKEENRRIQREIEMQEIQEIRQKEDLEWRKERENVLRQRKDKEQYLRNLGRQIREKNERARREELEEKQVYEGFQTKGEKFKYFDYDACKKWYQNMREYQDKMN